MAQADQVSSSVTTQTHILGLRLAHPNIYSIYDLLELVKGLVLWNPGQWQDILEEFRRGSSDDVVPEAFTRPVAHCNEHFSNGAAWTKGILYKIKNNCGRHLISTSICTSMHMPQCTCMHQSHTHTHTCICRENFNLYLVACALILGKLLYTPRS